MTQTSTLEGINGEQTPSVPGSSEKEIRRLSHLKLDNHRIGLDRKSGQVISDHETFTKGHGLDFHSGKTADRSILRVKKLDSLRTVSTGESPLEKRGPEFYSRDARVMFERSPITGVASQFYLNTQHARFLAPLALIRRSGTGGIRTHDLRVSPQDAPEPDVLSWLSSPAMKAVHVRSRLRSLVELEIYRDKN